MITKKLFLKKYKLILFSFLFIPICIFGIIFFYIQLNQSEIIKDEIVKLNQQHEGLVKIGSSRLSLFGNFPSISIKINDVKVLENKSNSAPKIIDLKHVYVGFNLYDILKGKIDIQSLLVKNGVFNIVIHKNNKTNIQNALSTKSNNSESLENIHLKKIKLINVEIHKLDEKTNTDIKTIISKVKGDIIKKNNHIIANLETNFELSVIKNTKSTFFKNKRIDAQTHLDYNESTGLLKINPSIINMEKSEFDLEGFIDTNQNMNLDLSIKGKKPNFNMFIAFAPKELSSILNNYKNAGEIYFNANIKGQSSNGYSPHIDVQFGASKAFLENIEQAKRIEKMGFNGHFTNGSKRNTTTTEFSLKNITAKLEEGNFTGSILVKNFEHPEVDMNIDVDFDLDFMTKFLNIKDVKNISGNVSLKMNFHDIIDINTPELTLNKINQAYFSELKVKNLKINSSNFPAPLQKLNLNLIMDSSGAKLKKFDVLVGNSDISVTGIISNLPAIIHRTEKPIEAHLNIKSSLIDITELTKYSAKDSIGVDEKIENLTLGLSFKTIAKELTEFKYLPKGEFLIDSLNAELKHYPHKLHHFHSDIFVKNNDLKIVDFSGFLDDSDFHINGLIHDYSFWFKKELNGDVDLDVNLTSDKLKLKDVFFYKTQNYIPKEYRHEELEKLALHINTSMHYKKKGLHSIDIELDKLTTKMFLHPLKFNNFNGKIHYEKEHLIVEDFHGEVGKTNFNFDINYYTGANQKISKKDNTINFKANYIDFDALNNFNFESNNEKITDTEKHLESFNLYELPFTNMKYNVNISHFINHRVDIQNIKAKFRTTPNHYIFIDTLNMNAAGGKINLSGYFNGSDPKNIYAKPYLEIENIDVDQLLFKFENFGQDHLISENLKGKLSTKISGKIKIYPDFVPKIDQSNLQMDLKVFNGRLKNYDPMLALSEYFGDKNLRNIKFDTLQNHLDVINGKIIIPRMTIESTLGHMEFSGSQDLNNNIDYKVRVPWKTIRKATKYKLLNFKKDSVDINQEDKIEQVDNNTKTRYLNLKIKGTIDDYTISLGKK